MTHTRLPTLAYLPCSCKDTSFTCLSSKTLWDQIRPQHKAEQTVRYLLIPCKKLFTNTVHVIVLRQKKKRAFLPQNSKLREWQMLTSCVSFWVKHAQGFHCYWPHLGTLSCPCKRRQQSCFRINLHIFRRSLPRFSLEGLVFFSESIDGVVSLQQTVKSSLKCAQCKPQYFQAS